jgi:phosphomevalonate kinase
MEAAWDNRVRAPKLVTGVGSSAAFVVVVVDIKLSSVSESKEEIDSCLPGSVHPYCVSKSSRAKRWAKSGLRPLVGISRADKSRLSSVAA